MSSYPWEDQAGTIGYWRLAEELSIYEIALLFFDCDPADFQIESRRTPLPSGHAALVAALCAAVRRESVTAVPVFFQTEVGSYSGGSGGNTDDFSRMDIHETKIDVESLIKWLRSRGQTTGFFFGGASSVEPYLDPDHERYPPKLAAAVKAWIAAGEISNGQTPKQQITKWLREHAATYGLTDSEGKLIDTAIEEVAKVANWAPKGGAPKSNLEPIPVAPKPRPMRPEPKPKRTSFADDLDSDMPF